MARGDVPRLAADAVAGTSPPANRVARAALGGGDLPLFQGGAAQPRPSSSGPRARRTQRARSAMGIADALVHLRARAERRADVGDRQRWTADSRDDPPPRPRVAAGARLPIARRRPQLPRGP